MTLHRVHKMINYQYVIVHLVYECKMLLHMC